MSTLCKKARRCAGVGTLTTKARPGPTPERHKLPPNSPPFPPPLWSEVLHIRAPNISPVLHRVRRDQYLPALWDEHRQCPVWTPSPGQSGVAHSHTFIERDDGCDAEDFVDAVGEVRGGFEFRKRDFAGGGGAELGEDDGAELFPDRRVAGEKVEDPAEQGADGVAACEEEGERFIAEL